MNYYNEFDKNAAAWLRELVKRGHLPPGDVDDRDVNLVEAKDLAGYTQCHFFCGIGGWPYALQLAGWPEDVPVWTASLPCFPAGTLVLTERGFSAIEDVEVGDSVLTHKQRFRKVTAVGGREAECVELKGQGHWGLICTPNHPFLSRAKVIDYRRKSDTYGKTVLENTSTWVDAKDMGGRMWAMPTQIPECAIPIIPKPAQITSRTNFPTDQRSPAFARFLGFWVGNGWTNRSGIVVCDGYEDVPLMEEILTEAGLTYCLSEGRTGVKALVGSQALRTWVPAQFGKGASNKTLPRWLLSAPQPYVEAFLRGWHDADGHWQTQKKGGSLVRVWTTTSRKLAVGLRILLNRCGYSASVRFVKNERELFIEGRLCNEKGYYKISAYDKARSFKFSDDLGWGLVKPVKKDGYRQVYNLAVEDDESYTADGIIVHNCQPFSNAGKQRGTDDHRHLWPVFHALVEQCRPPVIFGEQVPSKLGRAWLAAVRADLETLGYAVGAADLCAAGAGAPHIRQRLYWVANIIQRPAWEPCDGCDEFWCNIHEMHAFECPCPPIEEWDSDPYSVDNTQHPRLEGHGADSGAWREAGSSRPAARPVTEAGALNHWSDLIWLPCSDGKARPACASVQPLAHGLPKGLVRGGDRSLAPDANESAEARVMRLKGYGNAIVPPLAAIFIRSAREALWLNGIPVPV